MKKSKFVFVLLLLLTISVVAFGSTFLYVKYNNADDRKESLLIMTSCNPMYMATLNVTQGAEGILVENLSQPTTGCLHDYSLTTEDMKNLSGADVLIINGGGMEGYLDDVVNAYPDLPIIDTSKFTGESLDAELLSLEAENSHMWLSYEVYEKQVEAIASGLSEFDADNSEIYEENARLYIDSIEESLGEKAKEIESSLVERNVVILHEAYEYIAYDLGFNVVGVLDLDEERQVSAGEVASTISSIVDNDVKIVFAEKDYGQDMGELLEKSTECNVVYLNTLIHGTYSADDYIPTMLENYDIISNACK